MPARYASFKDYPRQQGPDGGPACAWCGRPLSGRRRRYCSGACRAEVEVRCGFDVLRRVFERDGGACARCGLDTTELEARLRGARKRHLERAGLTLDNVGGRYALFVLHHKSKKRLKRLHRFWARLGLTPHDAQKSLWEAHHRTPVADGGGACGLDGYETLCIWCHRRETAAGRKTG